jgi:alkanesulfonate monooxygenase SsuD/methylene tetrahydromethanopterin reductase-like flavin-dependent oxidoreductase (luciferase family)
MQHGLTFFPTDDSIAPADAAVAAEERGFESIWLAEHSHIPVSPATPGPPAAGEPGLPRPYYAVADPFVALAMAAAVTERLRLGTGICLVPQRDVFQTAKQVASLDLYSGGRFLFGVGGGWNRPDVFQTAKQVASLDLYSGGRFLFGVGGGWNRPEIEHHGTAFEQRFAVMRERIEAMKLLWTEEKAEYHGDHVDFGPSYAWPKPAQRPHPPIHVGGAGLRAIRRAVRYGDGWIPLMSLGDDDPIALLPRLREELERAGRDASGFEVTLYFCPPDPDVVKRAEEAGITRVLFPLASVPRDAALVALDTFAKLL